jgi:hypothetical protein
MGACTWTFGGASPLALPVEFEARGVYQIVIILWQMRLYHLKISHQLQISNHHCYNLKLVFGISEHRIHFGSYSYAVTSEIKIMSINFYYRRHAHMHHPSINSASSFSSDTTTLNRQESAQSSRPHGVPEELSFERIINNGRCPVSSEICSLCDCEIGLFWIQEVLNIEVSSS